MERANKRLRSVSSGLSDRSQMLQEEEEEEKSEGGRELQAAPSSFSSLNYLASPHVITVNHAISKGQRRDVGA